jgi:hypothetical protein
MALDSKLKQTVSDENWNKGFRVRHSISFIAKGACSPEYTTELLNTDKVYVVKSPDDVADIEYKNIQQMNWDMLDKDMEESHKRGIKMVWET